MSLPAGDLADEIGSAEYARLLGLPRVRPMEGDLADRAVQARAWFARNGRPWIAARRVAITRLADGIVTLETGAALGSALLATRLREGEAGAILALAVSAGPEIDAESRRLWEEGKPDESFFLDRFGAAVAERLVFDGMIRYCRRSEPSGETVLPHLSPGCGGWDFRDQVKLMALLTGGGDGIGPVRMLSSGMLTPKNSLLAALGVTKRQIAPSPADACRACDLTPCGFRRAPFRRIA